MDPKYKLNSENDIIIEDDSIIISSSAKVFLFEAFEKEIIELFDGIKTIREIFCYLEQDYGQSFVKEEFLEFFEILKDNEVLIEV